jgi:predicted nucleic-acid-binding protein
MSKRRLLDTNLIVRHLVQDNKSQALVAGRLFDACDRGAITLIILSAVVAEAVFVLESFYSHPPRNIADAMYRLLVSPGIELSDNEIHQAALVEYGKGKQHFVDCLIVAYAREHNWAIATFDQGFKKLTDIKIDLEVPSVL